MVEFCVQELCRRLSPISEAAYGAVGGKVGGVADDSAKDGERQADDGGDAATTDEAVTPGLVIRSLDGKRFLPDRSRRAAPLWRVKVRTCGAELPGLLAMRLLLRLTWMEVPAGTGRMGRRTTGPLGWSGQRGQKQQAEKEYAHGVSPRG
jgi:hypothetical protein